MTPAAPSAQHWVAETQLTSLSNWAVPEVWAVQVAPPLATRMTPAAPTTQHWVVEAQSMAPSHRVEPEVWAVQAAPRRRWPRCAGRPTASRRWR